MTPADRMARRVEQLAWIIILSLAIFAIAVSEVYRGLSDDTEAKHARAEKLNCQVTAREAKQYARAITGCLNGQAISADPGTFAICDPVHISGEVVQK